MKKILLLMTILVGALTAQAEDTYTYLTFESTDGAKVSVDVSSLPVTINLDNSTLTIGNQTFVLADLSKMYFSTNVTKQRRASRKSLVLHSTKPPISMTCRGIRSQRSR